MKKAYKIRTLISLAFLAVYVNVVATNVICNWGHLIEHSSNEHTHGLMGHDHHTHNNNQSNTAHSHSDKHEHSEKKDSNNCCDDETSKILSSLFSQDNNQFKLNNLLFACSENFYGIRNSFGTDKTSYKLASNYSLPPPKIPDIRVAIQSFQI